MIRPLSATAWTAACALMAVTEFSLAQQAVARGAAPAYPIRPVRLVISTTAGSQPDSIARLMIQKMSEHWGKPVILDNRPGGGGTLASALIAKAAPDGYTLMYVLPNFIINPALYPNFAHPTLKDFTGIAQIGYSTNILVISPSLGVKTAQDFVARAKAQPGKLIFGSSATGSASHLSGARFNHVTGIKVVTVAFKGGPDAAVELIAGRTHYTVATMGTALPFIKEGKMVPLGVTSPQRTPVLPDVPSLGELLPDFRQSDTSHGLIAPAATPRAVINAVYRESVRVLDLPDIKERLTAIGFVISPAAPETYDKILAGQTKAISSLVIAAGLRAK